MMRRGYSRLCPVAAVIVGALLLAACTSANHLASADHPSSVSEAARPTVAETTACATDHPTTWMGCLVAADHAFGAFPISGLALPGSDNAGTFNLDSESFDTQAGSVCTDFVAKDDDLGSEFARWTQTQDQNITEQLNDGVRFLDLQVAYNGNGSALTGWRVVQSHFSDWPLYDYLDQIASWAKAHPSEAVIVDLRNVCYDNHPSAATAAGLFANFDTPSNVGGGRTTLAEVAFDAGGTSRSFATTTIDQIVGQDGAGHNVVVLLPRSIEDAKVLTTKYHITPVFTVLAGSNQKGSSTALPLAFSDANVTPISTSKSAAANSQLASYELHSTPAFGSLIGSGLSEIELTYSFNPRHQAPLFARYGGLIESITSQPTKRRSPQHILPAWEASLWKPSGASALNRNGILAGWGHHANVVLADGVENDGYVAAVIALNAK